MLASGYIQPYLIKEIDGQQIKDVLEDGVDCAFDKMAQRAHTHTLQACVMSSMPMKKKVIVYLALRSIQE